MNFFNYLLPIKTWADNNYCYFKKNGYGRQFGVLEKFDDVPDEIWQIKNKIVDFYGLHNKKQEPLYKDYCGYITNGGAIHKHTDPNEGNLIHARYNVMVSKPFNGGEPIQNGFVLKVEEGDVWKCLAGRDTHWCNTVLGNKPRIVLSFGFLI
jgi:hypothetical protein